MHMWRQSLHACMWASHGPTTPPPKAINKLPHYWLVPRPPRTVRQTGKRENRKVTIGPAGKTQSINTTGTSIQYSIYTKCYGCVCVCVCAQAQCHACTIIITKITKQRAHMETVTTCMWASHGSTMPPRQRGGGRGSVNTGLLVL